ncbi:hypothetical protein E5F05_09010 [Deinococcus metallilatus]|uniref:Uncharacterized protein n=2 Tax=Deinococcus TaxID=1298 RepID=A0AAJ5F8E0_9DEIO|nr:hypothetical protein [Deinococcus metallilatus]MBB5295397.1 hypothetical protein [Deinococcus metallilatus]QBY08073.1 hypothetical protein E5F05_09010 [Deinococcus metallilatus]RXJ12966.1 hypothetical protein ERJ73_07835 [Deinococcus metallilatus]TLK27112.1 hypothetical protein FCS05_09480 [Deinococcus metallilatus]GMA16073.1 hypothetical protein GCM10025871_24040 [Deinococcus metallilatus]
MKLSNIMYILGFASILVSAGSFASGKTDDGESGNEKQRSGLFVGFWPPTFFLLGKIIEDRENKGQNILTGE